MAKSFWQRGEDYAKKVSSEIIDQIKAGVAPWQKPWKPGEQISAENFSTGKKYSGGNSLYLMSRAIRDRRGDNRWGTYNQIREAGGQVRKGEKGTQVLFFTDRNSRVAKDEKGQTLKNKEGKTIYEEQKRETPICKQYTVFNVEQAEGLELKPREGQVRPEWDAHRDAEKVIAAGGLLSFTMVQFSGARSVFHPRDFALLSNCQAICLPYDGAQSLEPRRVYLKPHYLPAEHSYWRAKEAGQI